MIIGITGHKGFIGTNLCNFFNKKTGWTIRTLDGYTLGIDLESSFVQGCDYIVHLGGKNKGTPGELIKYNLYGTVDLALSCLANNVKLLYIGSNYENQDAYKASKEMTTEALYSLNYNLGLKCACLLLPNVIGPFCRPYYNSFISTILYSIANGIEYKHLIRDEDANIEFVHVDQVAWKVFSILTDKRNEIDFERCNQIEVRSTNYATIREIIKVAESGKYDFVDKPLQSTLDWYRRNEV